jgi:hypothetical protein
MHDGPVILDSDTLSELARGHPRVAARAREYLEAHGRLTFTAITVFERLRGYQAALRDGKPYQTAVAHFEILVAASMILPFDGAAAERAATLWTVCDRKQRQALGDLLIAAIAGARGMPLVTRNRRDFEPFAKVLGLDLHDWSR